VLQSRSSTNRFSAAAAENDALVALSITRVGRGAGAVTSVAVSSGGHRFIIGTDDGRFGYLTRTNPPLGSPLAGHTAAVTSDEVDSTGRRIVSGSRDGTVRRWNARTGQPVGEPRVGHSGGVTSVAFSPDWRNILSGDGSTESPPRSQSYRKCLDAGQSKPSTLYRW